MTKTKPSISIITVVYNNKETIERTIKSVLHQKYPFVEYFIIDGGSTDGTLDIIKKYETQIAYWVSEPDKGISDAFNKGIARAKGNLIGLLNADDWYEENVLEKVAECYQQVQKEDLIIHGDLKNYKGANFVNERRSAITAFEDLEKCKMGRLFHPTMFITKSLYEKEQYALDKKYAMDYDLLIRLYQKYKPTFYYLDTVITNMSLEGISDIHYPKARKEVVESYKKYCNTNLDMNIFKANVAIYKNKIKKWLEANELHGVVDFYRKRVTI